MSEFQFGDDQNIDFGWREVTVEVERDCFTNVLIQFVHGLALREDILAYSTGTPGFAVVVDLDLDKHVVILALRRQ
jgi:hypothetical protein